MTWRTALYLLTVLLAATVVATTAMSDSSASMPPAGEGEATLAQIEPVAMPSPERSSRVVLLVLGVGAVVVTYRRAWLNFRANI